MASPIISSSPTTMAAIPAPTYQAPAVVSGNAYGDPNAPTAYNTLQPLTQFQVIQSENQFVPTGTGAYDVTLGKPEQYKDAAGNVYYTTSLPNATPANMLHARQQIPTQPTVISQPATTMGVPTMGSIAMPTMGSIAMPPTTTFAPSTGSIMMPPTLGQPAPFTGITSMPAPTLGQPIGLPQPTLGFPAQPTMSLAAPMGLPQQTFGAPITMPPTTTLGAPITMQPTTTLGAPITMQPTTTIGAPTTSYLGAPSTFISQ